MRPTARMRLFMRHESDVGCTGLRATAGDASTLQKGNMEISENNVSHYATWKRSYQPGIFWAGVENVFRGNSVSFGPHNGFLGGGKIFSLSSFFSYTYIHTQ